MGDEKEIITIPGDWNIHYDYAAGETASEFFRRLRDDARISGVKCKKCQRVLLPPRAFCDSCFVPIDEWVDVGQSGTIESFTITTHPFEGAPEVPYATAYVALDGAATAMLNFVEDVDLSDLKAAAEKLAIGTRVNVKWKEKREGRITDFCYTLA